MHPVEQRIQELFPGDHPETEKMRDHVMGLWQTFHAWGFDRGSFSNDICRGDCATFNQRYWEMLLADHLVAQGLAPQVSDAGPDFRVERDERVVWIEAVAPGPGTGGDRIPDRLVDPIRFIKQQKAIDPSWQPEAVSLPVDQVILRWASAIKAKYEKGVSYLSKGIIKGCECYVVAVNACNLGYGGLHCAEKYEIALRSVFPFGNIKATWNVETDEIVDIGRRHTPYVYKTNRAEVPTSNFLEQKHSMISALLATDVSPFVVPMGQPHFEFAVIHNPLARTPLPVGALSGDVEVLAKPAGGGFQLEWIYRTER